MTAGGAPKTVLIVIVNYKSASLTVDCLRSLRPEVEAYGPACAIVVENASGLDQVETIRAAIDREGWESWVTLVVAPSNGGFAAGNNVAIAPALKSSTPPDLIWLLNPDTIVRPGALIGLVEFLERHPEAGLAGSRLDFLDGTPQRSAFNFPTILGEIEGGLRLGPVSKVLRRHVAAPPVPPGECQVDWVAGASLMVRREVFEKVGLLDEGYFMYFEEVDFCLKALKGGWPCWYAPGSRVLHLVGQSSGLTKEEEKLKRRPRYWFDSRRRYFLCNHGRAKTFLADLAYTLTFATFRVRQKLQGKKDVDPNRMLRDFIRYNFLPGPTREAR